MFGLEVIHTMREKQRDTNPYQTCRSFTNNVPFYNGEMHLL